MYRRQLAVWLEDHYQVSLRKACSSVILSTSSYYYKSHKRSDAALRMRIRDIAQTRIRYGFNRILILLRREGFSDNHKRVYRIYKDEGLNLRSKRPRRSRNTAHRLDRRKPPVLTKCGAWILSPMPCLTAAVFAS